MEHGGNGFLSDVEVSLSASKEDLIGLKKSQKFLEGYIVVLAWCFFK